MTKKLSHSIVWWVGLWILKDNVCSYPDCNALDIGVEEYAISASASVARIREENSFRKSFYFYLQLWWKWINKKLLINN
jgi:hypothetical protein